MQIFNLLSFDLLKDLQPFCSSLTLLLSASVLCYVRTTDPVQEKFGISHRSENGDGSESGRTLLWCNWDLWIDAWVTLQA